MKNLLMIAYLFPPAGGTGSVRITKFAKYLPEFGWKPIVLTSYDMGISLDLSTLDDIHDDVSIYRVPGLEPRQHARQYRKKLLNAGYSRLERNVPHQMNIPTKDGIKAKLFQWLRAFAKDYLLIPDHAILWMPSAILKGLSLIRQHNIQVIHVTGGPWSSHLVGYVLSKLTGKSLVLDFRDPWALGPPGGWSNKLRGRYEGYLERKVVESADKVITVTSQLLHDFVERYPGLSRNFILITNGFDETDFEQYFDSWAHKSGDANAVFSIACTGTIRPSSSPKYFLLAIKRLIESSVISKDKIQLRFAGKIYRDIYDKYLYDYIKSYNLEKIARIDGFIPREEVTQIQFEADVLLLLMLISSSPIKGGPMANRIYEYTATRRPILALVPPNSSAIINYIRDTGVGVWAALDDVDDIASKVKLLYETRGSFLKRNEQEIAKYSRKVLTEQLAKVLDSCIR